MSIEFKKTDESCTNVFLIDQRLCLEKSYEIINTNVETLTSSLDLLQTYSNEYNNLYSNFSTNSSRWINAINNFQTLSSDWFSAETTVKQLSSYWQSDRGVIYDELIDIVDYYNNTENYKNDIKTRLNENFLDLCSNNQIVNVDVLLTESKQFSWSYYKQYYEDCIPPFNSVTGECKCPTPQRGCNYIWNTATGGFLSSCANTGAYCIRNIDQVESEGAEDIRCPNVGNRYITFDITTSREEILLSDDDDLTDGDLLVDKHICRTITLRYKKENNTFSPL